MLENLITQIACNLSPPAMTNTPVWPPLSHFSHLTADPVHTQTDTRTLALFCLQTAHWDPQHFHFQSNQKALLFSPHCPWGNFSLLTPLVTSIMHRLHAMLLYPHQTQASPNRHAQWICNVINPCSTYKDKGTRYMHWASATTRIPVPSKPCRKTLPAECFPINKNTLAAQGLYTIRANPVPTCFLTFP